MAGSTISDEDSYTEQKAPQHRRRNQGVLGVLSHIKFVSTRRNLVFHNRNVTG